jgi:hypothetical protein
LSQPRERQIAEVILGYPSLFINNLIVSGLFLESGKQFSGIVAGYIKLKRK